MRSQSSDYHEKEISKQLKKKNYYEILDLKQNATQTEIKKSFKQMALKYHPDKNSAAHSKQVFHQVSQAYDTLSDPSKRSAYDQKQQYQKIPKKSNLFKESHIFSQRSYSFYSNFDHEFRWNAYEYARKKARDQRMDDKARHEREKFRKEHNQKDKFGEKEFERKFFKRESKFSRDPQGEKDYEDQQKSFNNRKEQQPKQRKYYEFSRRNMNNEKTESQKQYEEKRRQKQRKQRLQRQREKANKNVSMFMMFLLVLVIWIYLDYNAVSFRGPPVYSIIQSTTHKIPKFTEKLSSPFYVTADYIERANQDDRFRVHIERKMDFAYIKLLSRVCNDVMHKQSQLYESLRVVKSAKSKNQVSQQIKLIDKSSCSKLHSLREMNPVYFEGLFNAKSSKQEL